MIYIHMAARNCKYFILRLNKHVRVKSSCFVFLNSSRSCQSKTLLLLVCVIEQEACWGLRDGAFNKKNIKTIMTIMVQCVWLKDVA